MTIQQAVQLAAAVGGLPYESGGGIWVVHLVRPDGKFVVLGPTGADVYHNRQCYEDYAEGKHQHEPHYLHWD